MFWGNPSQTTKRAFYKERVRVTVAIFFLEQIWCVWRPSEYSMTYSRPVEYSTDPFFGDPQLATSKKITKIDFWDFGLVCFWALHGCPLQPPTPSRALPGLPGPSPASKNWTNLEEFGRRVIKIMKISKHWFLQNWQIQKLGFLLKWKKMIFIQLFNF